MAQPETPNLKTETSGGFIGLGVRTGNDPQVQVLDERCFICCMDVKCWRHANTGPSVVVVTKAAGAEANKVSGCVIGLGIRSGEKKKKKRKKKKNKNPRKLITKQPQI